MIQAFFTPILVMCIRCYRLVLSPWFPAACRFEPTCSAYAIEALQRHGIAKGGFYSICRIFRCHPWGKSGIDPVPPVSPSVCSCPHEKRPF